MRICIKCYGDIAVPHDILQYLWIHAGFCHICTKRMSAHVRYNLWQLYLINAVVLAYRELEILLPMQRYTWFSVLIQEEKSGISVYNWLNLWLSSSLLKTKQSQVIFLYIHKVRSTSKIVRFLFKVSSCWPIILIQTQTIIIYVFF